MNGLEQVMLKERLRSLGLISTEIRRLRWEESLISVSSLLKGAVSEKTEKDSSQRCMVKGLDITIKSCSKGNSNWVQGRRYFPVRVIKHGNKLPRDAVQSLNSEIFKTCFDKALSSVTYEASAALGKQLDNITSKGRSQQKLFYDSLDRNNSYWKLQTAYLTHPLVTELNDQSSTDGFKSSICISKEMKLLIYTLKDKLINMLMLKTWKDESMDVEG